MHVNTLKCVCLNLIASIISRSKSCDSYHVFQNVENLVMEFVLEARARQVQILEKKNKDTPEMPQVFVFCKNFELFLFLSYYNYFFYTL